MAEHLWKGHFLLTLGDLFPEKNNFVVHTKRKSKGRAFGSLQVDFTATLQKKLMILICRTVSQPFS